ncbi:MAG: hypothetical protein LBH76_10450 [Propionibacteriaceae bacterium]|jgi:alternate signal-mediated exported protein|nr:hypothetical protein [Propionibacteriaceae bacterium]
MTPTIIDQAAVRARGEPAPRRATPAGEEGLSDFILGGGVGVPRHALRHRRKVIALAIFGMVVFTATAGVLALWQSAVTVAGPILTSGSLTAAASDFEWTETSSDVSEPERASGDDAASLAAFRAMPGDSLELRQGVAVTADGHNLAWDLTVTWTGSALDAPDGVTAVYWLCDAEGDIVAAGAEGAPVPVGTPLQITAGEPGATDFVVVIAIAYDGAAAPVYTVDGAAERPIAGLPPLLVNLQQTRGAS